MSLKQTKTQSMRATIIPAVSLASTPQQLDILCAYLCLHIQHEPSLLQSFLVFRCQERSLKQNFTVSSHSDTAP